MAGFFIRGENLKKRQKLWNQLLIAGKNLMLCGMNIMVLFLKSKKSAVKAIENWNIALKLDSTKTNLIKEIENCGK